MNNLWGFFAVSALVIIAPGPDTALTIRNTLLGTRRSGVFTAFGVAIGQATWTCATSMGIAALLVASGPAFLAVKVAGATYLVYLGLRGIYGAARAVDAKQGRPESVCARSMPSRAALRQGLVSNLGNPKMAIFFTSLLPQFAPHGGPLFAELLLLGLVFCFMTFLWLVTYAVVVARAGAVLRRSGVRRAIDGLTGIALIGIGLRVAVERR